MTKELPILLETRAQRRLRYFFSEGERWRGRGGLVSFTKGLTKRGDVWAFGGMVREMSLLRTSQQDFVSDVDLVVSGMSKEELDTIVAEYSGTRNRFGGYRMLIGRSRKWQVDLWRLEDTWAFQQNLVPLDSPASLLSTVFFSWDAAAYSLNTRKLLVSSDYFTNLAERKLDIVLSSVASPEKAALRALRFWLRHDARISDPLCDFLRQHAFPCSSASLARRVGPGVAPNAIKKLRQIVEGHSDADGYRGVPASLLQSQMPLPFS